MTIRKPGLPCLAVVTLLLSANLAAAPEATRAARDIALSPDPLRFHTTVTAYSSSPDETWGDPFITASGRRVFDGLVACPRKLPFGTRVRIADRQYECYDRLHPKYDDRFDIWMPSKHEALEFGARTLQVVVVALASPDRTTPPRERGRTRRLEPSLRDVPDVHASLSTTNHVERRDWQAELADVQVHPLQVAVECPTLGGDEVPLPELAARSEPRAPLIFTAADAILDRRAIL